MEYYATLQRTQEQDNYLVTCLTMEWNFTTKAWCNDTEQIFMQNSCNKLLKLQKSSCNEILQRYLVPEQ